MKRIAALAIVALLAFTPLAVAAEPAPEATPLNKIPPGAKVINAPSGLQYVDVVEGKGKVPEPGEICIVHYVLFSEDGKELGSSHNPRPVDPRDPSKGTKTLPFGFKLGSGQVIKGWDEGVATMREGGTRLLFVPPQLAYGEKGAGGGAIPPNARLTFRIELLKVKPDMPAPTPVPPKVVP